MMRIHENDWKQLQEAAKLTDDGYGELTVGSRDAVTLVFDLRDARAEVERLRGELAAAKQGNLDWMRENGPGGWIDTLRKELAAAEAMQSTLSGTVNGAMRVAEDWKSRAEAAEAQVIRLTLQLAEAKEELRRRHCYPLMGQSTAEAIKMAFDNGESYVEMQKKFAADATARAEAAEEYLRNANAELANEKQRADENYMAFELAAEKNEAATAHAADLRAALEAYACKWQWGLTHDNAKHCDWFLSIGLPADKRDGWAVAVDALARTPAQSLAAVKARWSRERAAELRKDVELLLTAYEDQYRQAVIDEADVLDERAAALEKEAGK